MNTIDRRNFLKFTALGATSAVLAGQHSGAADSASAQRPGIIDTNINLFDWPFRTLKYRETKRLVAKLRKHRVSEAWAGSFDALLSKDLNSVNARLADECRNHGAGFLLPFGSVNLAWPDWEEDVRRCHEAHKMPGLRIYPGYQPFDLNHPATPALLQMTAQRGLLLQVVVGMEDPRVHHPLISVGPVTLAPLVKAMASAPNAKVQLLHVPGAPDVELARFLQYPNTALDISRLEGNGALGRILGTVEGLPSARVPAERLVFGSHAPYFPIETALLKLMESPLDAGQLNAITHENARRLRARSITA